MKKAWLPFLALLFLSCGALSAGEIDRRIDAALAARNITPSGASDPARFVRRCFLVVTDRIPSRQQTLSFLACPDREALVDSLLASEGFVEHLVLKWGDMLRIKSEFPSCMWPNAVQAFNKWLTLQMRANTPYNEFVANLLQLVSGILAEQCLRHPDDVLQRLGNEECD